MSCDNAKSFVDYMLKESKSEYAKRTPNKNCLRRSEERRREPRMDDLKRTSRLIFKSQVLYRQSIIDQFFQRIDSDAQVDIQVILSHFSVAGSRLDPAVDHRLIRDKQ